MSKTPPQISIATMSFKNVKVSSENMNRQATHIIGADNPSFKDSYDGECHLQRMPAEIRSEIFRLTVVEEHTIDVTQKWPGITGTCKQFREEALAIYFGNSTFTARVIDLDDKAIVIWLEAIKATPLQAKRLISTLTIVVEGRLVDITPAYPTSVGAFLPDESFWFNIVSLVKDAGLTAGQIRWPSSRLAAVASGTWSHLPPFQFPNELDVASVVLYHDILPDLLKQYGLLDSAGPPSNVTGSLFSRYGWRLAT